MEFSKFVPPLLKGWVISFTGFGLLAIVLVGQLALVVSMPMHEALRIAARDWLPWAIVAPLIFLLVFRLPLEREHWKVALPAHALSAAAILMLSTWWGEIVLPPRQGPARPVGNRMAPLPPPRPSLSRMESDGLPAGISEMSEIPRTPPGDRDEPPPPPIDPGRPPYSVFLVVGFRLPIYLALVSGAHALHFYRRSRERERRWLGMEAGLANARLGALKMQLQPHFLFNSLNAIAALVHKDPDAADEMLVALSDLLRLSLETSGEQELPLRRELEFVERYLAIERIRFGDRLQFQCDVPGEMQAALVPAFLLQPLVENAVRHGLEPQSRTGLLEIRARREGATLHLSVGDNGAGLPKTDTRREGIGLGNTRARLQELYGDAATLKLRNSNGLTVEITLPFHKAES